MLGNCATGKLRTVSEPTNTMTMEITMATMGRLMKNFDMDHASLSIHRSPVHRSLAHRSLAHRSLAHRSLVHRSLAHRFLAHRSLASAAKGLGFTCTPVRIR